MLHIAVVAVAGGHRTPPMVGLAILTARSSGVAHPAAAALAEGGVDTGVEGGEHGELGRRW